MLLVLAAVCEAEGGKAAVRLSARVSVGGDAIRLGDIARITGDDASLVRRLKKVDLGTAPAPGESRKMADRHIRLRLKRQGFNLSRVRLLMPRHIVVSRAYVEISEDAIKKAATDYIYRTVPRDRSDITISRIRLRGSVRLPKGKITYKVIPPKRSDLLGTVSLPVQFYRNGAPVKKVIVSAKVEVMANVLVAKRPLAKYQTIEPDHVQLKKMKLSRFSSDVVTDMEAVSGKRAKRKIKPGDVLRGGMIEMPPLVNRGDIVVIVVRSGGLKITTLGKAKNKGGLGEKIQVQNLESRKYLHATVIDAKTVKVDFRTGS